jgi:splicing factor 3A subunit 3
VKIQEHHSKYPDSIAGGFDLELAALLEEPDPENADEEYEEEDRAYSSSSSPLPFSFCVSPAISLLFSGEEGYGKYLDLYANHTAYCNLKNIGKRPGYLQYLDLLLAAQNGPVHQDLPKETRFAKDFEKCVNLIYYFRSTVFNLEQLHPESSCLFALLFKTDSASS